jgi:hypothetical protein
MILRAPSGRTVDWRAPARVGSYLFVRRQAMTDTSPADRYAWRTSADIRDAETRSDAMVRARAADRNAGWVRFATLMLVAIGVFQIVTGLSALLRRSTFLLPESRLALDVDYGVWGWLFIYGITVHGSREGSRFYADRA